MRRGADVRLPDEPSSGVISAAHRWMLARYAVYNLADGARMHQDVHTSSHRRSQASLQNGARPPHRRRQPGSVLSATVACRREAGSGAASRWKPRQHPRHAHARSRRPPPEAARARAKAPGASLGSERASLVRRGARAGAQGFAGVGLGAQRRRAARHQHSSYLSRKEATDPTRRPMGLRCGAGTQSPPSSALKPAPPTSMELGFSSCA